MTTTGMELVPRPQLQARDDGTIIDTRSGEAVVLRELDGEQVAAAQARLIELVANLADVDRVIKAELLRRLDADGKWTQRFGDATSGQQIEVKAPSPTSGTEAYDRKKLEQKLAPIRDRGELSDQLWADLFPRVVVVRAEGYGEEAKQLLAYAREHGLEEEVKDSAVPIGSVRRLEKLPARGIKTALKEARSDRPAPQRTPKVQVLDVDRERRR